ncbi:MAG TPA: MarR family winged helix-turn-helix transcriptional regulator [Beijerinckiaceae bacterium]|nr:MarR family winged helix-turn-helix transcriptional regulator [Beijerinckiaceae bacterium]
MANNPFLWWLPTGTPDQGAARTPAPPPPDGLPDPGPLIRRAQQIAVAIFLEECAELDLTPVQHAVLATLADHPGSDATRIAGLTGFDRTTISGVMERLEAKGLISRKALASDRRIKTLALTAAGRRLLARAEPLVEKVQQRILAPLPKQEQELLLILLARLVEANNGVSRAPRRGEPA